jgi:hypothetical protein
MKHRHTQYSKHKCTRVGWFEGFIYFIFVILFRFYIMNNQALICPFAEYYNPLFIDIYIGVCPFSVYQMSLISRELIFDIFLYYNCIRFHILRYP